MEEERKGKEIGRKKVRECRKEESKEKRVKNGVKKGRGADMKNLPTYSLPPYYLPPFERFRLKLEERFRKCDREVKSFGFKVKDEIGRLGKEKGKGNEKGNEKDSHSICETLCNKKTSRILAKKRKKSTIEIVAEPKLVQKTTKSKSKGS